MTHKHGVSFLAGLLTGWVIGAISILLVAPQSGEETRTEIRDKGIELREKAETAYVQARGNLQTAVADLKTKFTKETRNLSESSVPIGNDVPDR